MRGQLAFIRFLDPQGRPIDPGYGVDQGGSPDQGLPPGEPGYPDQGLPGRPGHPGHPGHPIARPPWDIPWPPGPVDPEWGVDGDLQPSFPIYLPIAPDQGLPPGEPGTPDQGLPPVAGHLPAPDPPPGTIWPPLPPSAPPGKAALLVWLTGVGYRYVVVTIPPPTPSHPIAGEGGGEEGAQPKRR